MCGIFGSTFRLNQDVIGNKLKAMNNRGPDYSAFKEYGTDIKIILGHNRLAIVDLDERSNQPFEYENLVVVFNGEIYNFIELREELVQKGYIFRTKSDTEVLTACYLAFGETCVSMLNGMFAFVIYDKVKNILFGARDRLGKKPFYYNLDEQGFEFASQLSALEIGNDPVLCKESLLQYLYWNYIPEPKTPYHNYYKLPSAHFFKYFLDTREFNTFRYWDLPEYRPQISKFITAKSELKNLLIDSVKKRLISDVPLGVFLSGGVDSSLVCAIAQSISDKKIKTFSIKFNEEGFDESEYAKAVAGYLNTDHKTIECSFTEGIDFIRNYHLYYDEPFADSSAIPSLLLSKYTKTDVTVALSGDGGDETFMGYNIYDVVNKREWLYRMPYVFRLLVSFLFEIIPGHRYSLIAKALRLKNVKEFYLSYFKGLNRSWISKKEKEVAYIDYLFKNPKPLMEVISDFDTKTYLNGDCITKVERASMAFSLEVRSPLMDYRVVEFVRKIPTDFKYQVGNKKRILKEVLYDYLPKSLFQRRKTGFGMPLGEWFRRELKEYVYETLSDDNLALVSDLIDKDEFKRVLKRHMDGDWNHTPDIWKVMVLINWLKRRNG